MRTTAARFRRSALAALAAVLLGCPATAAASPLTGDWPLDAATTGPAADSTPDTSGNGLALSSAPNTMQFGTGGGLFGGHLSAASTTPLTVTSPLLAPAKVTLLTWIRQSGDPGRLRYIAGRGDDGGYCGGSSYGLYTGYAAAGALHFYIRSGTGPALTSVLTDPADNAKVFDGAWHLVAGTFDGANARLYVDGVQVGSPKPSAAPINYALPGGGGQEFYVDGYPLPHATCPDTSDFPGLIDEVRVYDRALSPTELGRLAAAAGPTPPALVPDAGPDPGPPPGPAPPPTPTPTPTPGSSGPPPARAAFSPYRGAGVKGTLLDASATINATTLDWDLNGDRTPDVTCPGSQPFLRVAARTAATANVTLTAAPTVGAPARVSSSISLKGLNPPRAVAKYAPPDVATCARTVTPLLAVVQPKVCVPQTVIWNLVSAQGCFLHSDDPSDVPSLERAIVKRHYDSDLYPAVVVALCRQAANGTIPQAKCDEAKAFFGSQKYDVYVARTPVDLNGITLTPRPGTAIVIFPALNRIVARFATMTWGGMTVRSGGLDFNFRDTSNIRFSGRAGTCACGRSEVIARYDGARDLPDIAGFKLNGGVDLTLEGINGRRYSSGVLQLRLPAEFGLFGGSPPSGSVRALANNGHRPDFDAFDLRVPEAFSGRSG